MHNATEEGKKIAQLSQGNEERDLTNVRSSAELTANDTISFIEDELDLITAAEEAEKNCIEEQKEQRNENKKEKERNTIEEEHLKPDSLQASFDSIKHTSSFTTAIHVPSTDSNTASAPTSASASASATSSLDQLPQKPSNLHHFPSTGSIKQLEGGKTNTFHTTVHTEQTRPKAESWSQFKNRSKRLKRALLNQATKHSDNMNNGSSHGTNTFNYFLNEHYKYSKKNNQSVSKNGKTTVTSSSNGSTGSMRSVNHGPVPLNHSNAHRNRKGYIDSVIRSLLYDEHRGGEQLLRQIVSYFKIIIKKIETKN